MNDGINFDYIKSANFGDRVAHNREAANLEAHHIGWQECDLWQHFVLTRPAHATSVVSTRRHAFTTNVTRDIVEHNFPLANGGAECDGALPMQGHLLFDFFRFAFYIALDGKKV
ncbi:hypothetical protein JHK86_001118 [Glycine max]|nr:hypothetical protein JHK86_001118 [Glycine max]